MISGFVYRRPWATIVLAVILGPTIGMFYLGKGRKGLAYLLVGVLASGLPFLAVHFELLSLDLGLAPSLLGIAVRVVGVPHCYFVCKRLEDRRPPAWFARWYSIVGIILVAPLVAAVERTLAYEPFSIPSGSMVPTLLIGDHLFVSKASYGYSRYSLPLGLPFFEGRLLSRAPERGDVAVFRKPPENEEVFVFRIIGLPGDRIQVVGGILQINGEAVKRVRIDDFFYTPGSGVQSSVPHYLETLPNGVVYPIIELRGDTGFADNTRVFEVPPGHYFAMGDNRDNAADSRTGWTVPLENFVGPARVIFWNSGERKIKWLPVGAERN